MSQHRTWDENRSPQWKYLFQQESLKRRKTRREVERERKITKEENEREYSGKGKKSSSKGKKTRKFSKEQLRAKVESTNREIRNLLKYNASK